MKNLKVLFFIVILMIFSFRNSYASEKIIDIKGTSAITIDMKTSEIIYSKNMDSLVYPASTTKLMTALILSKMEIPYDILTYSDKAKLSEPFSINYNIAPIAKGTKFTAEDSMKAMLMSSANDIAYMIGENVGGNIATFANLMNTQGESLHLTNTHFVNSTGLPDKNHYTTAYDMGIIGKTAFSIPWILNSVKDKETDIKSLDGKIYKIQTTNKLLDIDGCIGGKTGYTKEASRCLVAIFERNDRKILGVVMNSIYDKEDKTVFEDMKKIIDYSYGLQRESIFQKNSIVKSIDISYKILPFLNITKNTEINLYTSENVLRFPYGEPVNVSYKLDELKGLNPLKINKNYSYGKIIVSGRLWENSYPLYSDFSILSIIKQNIFLYSALILIFSGLIYFIIYYSIYSFKNGKADS